MVSTTRRGTSVEEKSASFSRRPSNRIYVDEHEYSERENENEARVINVPRLDFSSANTERENQRHSKDTYQVPKIRVNAVPVKREREDLMPTIKSEKQGIEQKEQRQGMEASFHSKLMLAIYVAVVVILAAIVIGTGYAITNSADNVARLESQLAQRNDLVLEYSQRLELLSDETYNRGRGAELGMGNIDNYIEVDLVDEIDVLVYEERTNWFDKFCDFLGGLVS